MVGLLMVAMLALNAMHQTASRLTWSFASDNAMIFSSTLKKVNTRFRLPLNALLLNYAACFIIGLLHLASSSGESRSIPGIGNLLVLTLAIPQAFNAFIGSCSILSVVSVTIPIMLLLVQRRSSKYLPPNRPCRLPSLIGFFCNAVAVAWSLQITVFFCLPTTFPLTASNMSEPIIPLFFASLC